MVQPLHNFVLNRFRAWLDTTNNVWVEFVQDDVRRYIRTIFNSYREWTRPVPDHLKIVPSCVEEEVVLHEDRQRFSNEVAECLDKWWFENHHKVWEKGLADVGYAAGTYDPTVWFPKNENYILCKIQAVACAVDLFVQDNAKLRAFLARSSRFWWVSFPYRDHYDVFEKTESWDLEKKLCEERREHVRTLVESLQTWLTTNAMTPAELTEMTKPERKSERKYKLWENATGVFAKYPYYDVTYKGEEERKTFLAELQENSAVALKWIQREWVMYMAASPDKTCARIHFHRVTHEAKEPELTKDTFLEMYKTCKECVSDAPVLDEEYLDLPFIIRNIRNRDRAQWRKWAEQYKVHKVKRSVLDKKVEVFTTVDSGIPDTVFVFFKKYVDVDKSKPLPYEHFKHVLYTKIKEVFVDWVYSTDEYTHLPTATSNMDDEYEYEQVMSFQEEAGACASKVVFDNEITVFSVLSRDNPSVETAYYRWSTEEERLRSIICSADEGVEMIPDDLLYVMSTFATENMVYCGTDHPRGQIVSMRAKVEDEAWKKFSNLQRTKSAEAVFLMEGLVTVYLSPVKPGEVEVCYRWSTREERDLWTTIPYNKVPIATEVIQYIKNNPPQKRVVKKAASVKPVAKRSAVKTVVKHTKRADVRFKDVIGDISKEEFDDMWEEDDDTLEPVKYLELEHVRWVMDISEVSGTSVFFRTAGDDAWASVYKNQTKEGAVAQELLMNGRITAYRSFVPDTKLLRYEVKYSERPPSKRKVCT